MLDDFLPNFGGDDPPPNEDEKKSDEAGPKGEGGEDGPQSFDEMLDSLKDSGVSVADAAKDEAIDGGKELGKDLAASAIEDMKNGNPPDVGALKDQAVEGLKGIAQATGEAALEEAKAQAAAQVDNAMNIIGNEFPILGGILGILAKPIIDMALSKVQMPEF